MTTKSIRVDKEAKKGDLKHSPASFYPFTLVYLIETDTVIFISSLCWEI
jgi:hypothetical protein